MIQECTAKNCVLVNPSFSIEAFKDSKDKSRERDPKKIRFLASCTHDSATGTCYFREAATGKWKVLVLFTVDYSQVKWPPPCEVDQPFPGNLPITGMVHNKK